MSLSSWNLGLDDAACGNDPRTSRSNDSDYQEGYAYGLTEPNDDVPKQQPPEPSAEDICGGMGHPYYGADGDGPRCYCGERRTFEPGEIPSSSNIPLCVTDPRE